MQRFNLPIRISNWNSNWKSKIEEDAYLKSAITIVLKFRFEYMAYVHKIWFPFVANSPCEYGVFYKIDWTWEWYEKAYKFIPSPSVLLQIASSHSTLVVIFRFFFSQNEYLKFQVNVLFLYFLSTLFPLKYSLLNSYCWNAKNGDHIQLIWLNISDSWPFRSLKSHPAHFWSYWTERIYWNWKKR